MAETPHTQCGCGDSDRAATRRVHVWGCGAEHPHTQCTCGEQQRPPQHARPRASVSPCVGAGLTPTRGLPSQTLSGAGSPHPCGRVPRVPPCVPPSSPRVPPVSRPPQRPPNPPALVCTAKCCCDGFLPGPGRGHPRRRTRVCTDPRAPGHTQLGHPRVPGCGRGGAAVCAPSPAGPCRGVRAHAHPRVGAHAWWCKRACTAGRGHCTKRANARARPRVSARAPPRRATRVAVHARVPVQSCAQPGATVRACPRVRACTLRCEPAGTRVRLSLPAGGSGHTCHRAHVSPCQCTRGAV